MLTPRAKLALRSTESGLEPLPAECLANDCQAAPDPDLPVPLCLDHGIAVYCTYARATPERVNSVQNINTNRSPVGWVYFMRRGDLIKIGWSGDVERRADQLDVDAILHSEPGTKQDERKLHAAFEYLRVEGMGREWFAPDPHMMSFILRLQTGAA